MPIKRAARFGTNMPLTNKKRKCYKKAYYKNNKEKVGLHKKTLLKKQNWQGEYFTGNTQLEFSLGVKMLTAQRKNYAAEPEKKREAQRNSYAAEPEKKKKWKGTS